jgi:uncharacterized protein YxeA
MNKLVSVLAIAVIILGIISGFLFYQLNAIQSQNNELRSQNTELNRNSELENQISQVSNKVNITEFSISGLRAYEEFVIWESDVYVKIQNLGINDLEGLTLEIVGFGDERLAESLQVDTLHFGEEKEIYTHAYWAYGSEGTSVATLMLDDVVLDEYLLPFS